MALIKSKWQITLGATTLLDFNDLLEEEALITRSNAVDIVATLGADHPTIFERANALFQLSFNRIKIFQSDQEARSFLFTYPAALPNVTNDCVITDTAVTITLSDATFQQSGYNSTTDSEWFLAQNQIIGGPLSISGITPPAPVGFILLEGGDYILLEGGDKIILE